MITVLFLPTPSNTINIKMSIIAAGGAGRPAAHDDSPPSSIIRDIALIAAVAHLPRGSFPSTPVDKMPHYSIIPLVQKSDGSIGAMFAIDTFIGDHENKPSIRMFGGASKHDESPCETLVREFKEETPVIPNSFSINGGDGPLGNGSGITLDHSRLQFLNTFKFGHGMKRILYTILLQEDEIASYTRYRVNGVASSVHQEGAGYVIFPLDRILEIDDEIAAKGIPFTREKVFAPDGSRFEMIALGGLSILASYLLADGKSFARAPCTRHSKMYWQPPQTRSLADAVVAVRAKYSLPAPLCALPTIPQGMLPTPPGSRRPAGFPKPAAASLSK
jgi:8-oxo-dGTP pyrophosphatase MutT (NUDIX family)